MSSRPAWLSPSLSGTADGSRAAFEMKFAVTPAVADELQSWAAERLRHDPHSDPTRGYLITSTYFDTPAFDVFRRTPGYDVHKYRVRRYGTEPTVHLEKKSKADGRVWKVRGTMPLADLNQPLPAWGVEWFTADVGGLGLRPVCVVSYRRSAFIGDGAVRMTLDREAFGITTAAVSLDPISTGTPLLTDLVVVELKFMTGLPALFKEAVERFRLQPTGVSKYRRCVRAAGLANGTEGANDA
ncbi:MAG: polyphosphate polymerase domain-containing protein [Fimbriiglobus sp.]|nr:polyphosphate polymerase domain-containing protein [Fimbriiglobus sp.]